MTDILNMGSTLLQTVIITAVSLLSVFLIKFLRARSANLKEATDNIFLESLIDTVTNLVEKVVASVSQTYVDKLKEDEQFDESKHKVAFELAFEAVKSMVSEEYQTFLDGIFGDFNLWIGTLIEAAVRTQKFDERF